MLETILVVGCDCTRVVVPKTKDRRNDPSKVKPLHTFIVTIVLSAIINPPTDLEPSGFNR